MLMVTPLQITYTSVRDFLRKQLVMRCFVSLENVCAKMDSPDGADLMTGKVKGFEAKVQELNPEIRFDHSFIHHEAIVAKI